MSHASPVGVVSRPLTLFGAGLLCFGLAGVGRGDEEPAPTGNDAREAIVRIAQTYELFLGAERVPLEMQKEPVLRWPNPTREVPDGATFVWTLDGRPVAIGCIWKHGVVSHAFHSLSTEKLVAERDGQTIWHPEKAGVEFREFADAPRPADSPVKRLSQMKELARRFTCRLSGGGRQGEELRFLPRPVFRYKTRGEDLDDGALFAYVQGTDPEVILLVEAARQNDHFAWRYALTRRSMLALEADLDGQRVWTVPHGAGDPGSVWFQGGIASGK